MRFTSYPRRELRRRRRAWLMARTRLLTTLITVTVMLIAASTAMLWWAIPAEPARFYLIGVAQAGLFALVAHQLWMAFVMSDDAVLNQVRGASGEDFTRDELRRARWRRLVWGSVDSIQLAIGDIDHLVVSRRRGVLAVDSKWRSTPLSPDEASAAARRTALRANALIHTVWRAERGTHRASGRATTVVPVVVVWGPQRMSIPEGGVDLGGAHVLRGDDFVGWLRAGDASRIDRSTAADLVRSLEKFRTTVWTAQAGEALTPSA